MVIVIPQHKVLLPVQLPNDGQPEWVPDEVPQVPYGIMWPYYAIPALNHDPIHLLNCFKLWPQLSSCVALELQYVGVTKVVVGRHKDHCSLMSFFTMGQVPSDSAAGHGPI
jgi:hypothetical protein